MAYRFVRRSTRISCALLCACSGVVLLGAEAAAPPEPASAADNGTDPTKLTSFAVLGYEHLDLRENKRTDTGTVRYGTPVTKSAKTNLIIKVPFVNTDLIDQGGVGVGDISFRMNNVWELNRSYGIVLTGEIVLNTADRIDRGSGQNVGKGAITYAKFLSDGSIFAPAMQHSQSIWGDDGRAQVRNTVLDLYYVPRLSDLNTFVTLDPSISADWENRAKFFGLAVTVGRALGKFFDADMQVSAKPSILLGSERPANWGIEISWKLLNF